MKKRWIIIAMAALALIFSQVACDESGGISAPTCPSKQVYTCLPNKDGSWSCGCVPLGA